MKTMSRSRLQPFKFDTAFHRFSSLWWLTGAPFFLFRCFMKRDQLWQHPSEALLIAMRNLIETCVLWMFNELILSVNKNRKQ